MMEELSVVAVKELNYQVEEILLKREEEKREKIKKFGVDCFYLGYGTGYDTGYEIAKKEDRKGN